MSQSDFGNLSSPLPGTTFINTYLEPWRDALHSCHSGTSRPSYAVAGTLWLNTSATPWVLNMFDGTDDISIGTVNTTTNAFTPSGISGGFYTCGTAGGTANALTATAVPTLSAYASNIVLSLVINATNTSGSVTVNISSLGTKNVKKFIGGSKVDIAVGDLYIGMVALLSYDGTDLILLNPPPFAKGATVASASTVNLTTTTGNYVQISGTTTITGITLAEGKQVKVKFDGALTLTNGANLILPTGANITTAAGDTAEFVGEASGVVRCIDYQKANGQALAGGGAAVIVKTASASSTLTFSSSELDFTNNLGYDFEISNLDVDADARNVYVYASVDNFSNSLTIQRQVNIKATGTTVAAETEASSYIMKSLEGTPSNGNHMARFRITQPSITADAIFSGVAMFENNSAQAVNQTMFGAFFTSGATLNAVRVGVNAGSMTTATIVAKPIPRT